MSDTSSTLLSTLLNSELIRWLVTEVVQFWKERQFQGTYKVLDHVVTLELKDRLGHTAIYTKRQQVDFQQNGVFAIQDQAWGDGDIFASYRCSPGVLVDKHIESYRWKLLISLRTTKNRGDHEEFLIERTIKNGFTTETEHFETQIDHQTKQLRLSVIFPRTRLPHMVSVMEQNSKRSFPLGKDNMEALSEGRVAYHWTVTKPRLFEAYVIRWEW